MDVVGVMTAYLPVVRVYTAQCREALHMECQVGHVVCVLIVIDARCRHEEVASDSISNHIHLCDIRYLSWSLYFQGYFISIKKEMRKRHDIL